MTDPYEDLPPDPLTGARPLRRAHAAELLGRVLERARAGAPRSLVVFDLDSTLLDNSPRQARILREYGASVGHPVLAGASAEHWDGWDAAVAMRNVGLSDEDVARHAEPFKAYWRKRFFTSEYCCDDEAIAGAQAFVAAVCATGASVYYVTGRHELMREGSIACFRRVGLPVPDGDCIHLLMKPTLEENDDAYKERTYAELRSRGEVVAAFDNEPTHINGYRRAFPDALVVHLFTDHSLRDIRVAAGISSIRDFTPYAPSPS